MKKFYTFAIAVMMSAGAFSSYALDEGVTALTVDPAEGTVSECPTVITLTYEGPTKITKKSFTSPGKIYLPDGTTKPLTLTYLGNVVTINTGTAFDATVEGTYEIKVIDGAFSYNWADDSKTANTAFTLTYEVGGAVDAPIEVEPGVTATLDPSNSEELEAFPETFTITYDGPVKISKNVVVSAPVRIQEPGSDSWLSAKSVAFDGNNLTVTVNPAMNLELSGEYIVEVKKNGVKYVWEDNSSTGCVLHQFVYNVKGNGQDPSDQPVQADIQFTFSPKLDDFDASMRTWETLQIIGNGSCLEVVGEPVVTITGPNYNYSAPLLFNMGTATSTSTWFKVSLPDPTYNGEYKITIPAGAVGDAAYVADHEKGRTNAAFEKTFNVIGGKDPSTITEDLTFNASSVSPAPKTKVSSLENVILTFPEKVYFDAEATMDVAYYASASATGTTPFGVATLERVSDTELHVVFDPVPEVNREYVLSIPKGVCWNEAHELDENAGAMNNSVTYNWIKVKSEDEKLSVVSVTPAKNAAMPRLEKFVVNVDNPAIADKMVVVVTRYKEDSDTAAPKVLGEYTTTEKDGNDIVLAFETPVEFAEGYFYEIAYTIYNAAGESLADDIVEYSYSEESGVQMIGTSDENVKIYNLQGIEIRSSKSELPAGMYIVNGKKLVIRK